MEHFAEYKFLAAQSLNINAAIFSPHGHLLSLTLRDRLQHPAFGFPALRGLRWLEFVHEDDFAATLQTMAGKHATAVFRFYAPIARRWFDIGMDRETIGSLQFCLLHISPAAVAGSPGSPSSSVVRLPSNGQRKLDIFRDPDSY